MSEKTIVTAGVGGMLGSELIEQLTSEGHYVIRLVRPSSGSAQTDTAPWQPGKGELDPAVLEGVDAVICMNGANVAGQRWTADYKRELRESRIQPTRLLAETMAGLEKKPEVFLLASAVGIYGNRGDEILDESSSHGNGFLVDLAEEWEAAADRAVEAGIRVVKLRIGVVLGPDGGALEKMLTPFSLGLGGPVGSGKQYMSWVAIEDVIEAFVFCMNEPTIDGAVNLVAPNPVTNAAFGKALGRALHRPAVLPLPGFMVKLMFGEMGEALLLGGNRVLPGKLQEAGFSFRFPDLDTALVHQMKKR